MTDQYHDIEVIRNAACQLFGTNFIETHLLIAYGSRQIGRDIDLCVVQSTVPPTRTFVAGDLDFLAFSDKSFEWLVDHLDPLATEPILTGQRLSGPPDRWARLKRRVATTDPEGKPVTHCRQRSLEEYIDAQRLWARYEEQGNVEFAQYALQNLSFSISFASFARFYSCPGNRPISLQQLIDQDEVLLPEFWQRRRGLKSNAPSSFSKWMRLWGDMLFD